VRTDPDAAKHAGISYILIDMKTPGITVRPLVQMTGDAGFNEVFFEDVRVPRANVVGQLNAGWQVANATLAHERNMLGSTTRTQQTFQRLVRLARTHRRNGPATGCARRRLTIATRVETMTRSVPATHRCALAAAGHQRVGDSWSRATESPDLARGAGDRRLRLAREGADRGRRHRPNDHMFALGLIVAAARRVQEHRRERGLGAPAAAGA
jgi:alkylation response protein AidB-like acyl-CoA dehydrogenase